MNTVFLLLTQFGGRAVIPWSEVQKAFFSHIEENKLLLKIYRGEVALPVMRAERSQKSARGVHLLDLAAYIDKQREAAAKERDRLCGLTGNAKG